MSLRRFLLLTAIAVNPAFAQVEPPSKLPIEVPRGASISFEADASGKEMIPIVKHLLNGNMSDPTDPGSDKISVKTSLGTIDLSVDDFKPLLDPIKELHIVVYNFVKGDDPFQHHERRFLAAGMKRIAFEPGPNGVLIMRKHDSVDRYGIVIRQKDSVVVLRTEGAPSVGDIGKAAFESLARAVQKAAKPKAHGGD